MGTDTQKPGKMGADTGGMGPQAQDTPRSWKGQEGPSPGACGGSAALSHLDFSHLVSRMEMDKSLLC